LKKRISFLLIFILFQFILNANDVILEDAKRCTGELICVNALVKEIGQLESDSLRFETYMEVGNIFGRKGKYEMALFFYDKMNHGLGESDLEKKSSVAAMKGKAHLYSGDLEQAYHYFSEQLSWSEKTGEKNRIAVAKTNLGNVHRKKGEVDLSINNFHESISLLEEVNDIERLGMPYMLLGILYGMQDNEKKAIDAFRQAVYYFELANNQSDAAASKVNLANAFISINEPDSAIFYLNNAIPVFEANDELRELCNANTQLARAYGIMGNDQKALTAVIEATAMAEQLNIPTQLAYNYRLLSKTYRALGKPELAVTTAKKSMAEHEKIGINDEYHRSLNELAQAYGESGNYKKAFEYAEQSRILSDSLFNEQREYEMEKAEEKFEAERKAIEIAIIEGERNLEKVKRSRFQLLALLILLSALAGIGFLIFKNRKEKQQLNAERDIEIAHNKNLELEKVLLQKDLFQKKRELVSNTLLISKKNEFLKSLLEQIESGAYEPKKVKRLVQSELQSDADWDDFIAAFRDSHQNFIQGLFEIESRLSKTELRLACLLKMNLQAKEIASLLNISHEGVKKAKYRLKKRLHLDSSYDLQGYLLALS